MMRCEPVGSTCTLKMTSWPPFSTTSSCARGVCEGGRRGAGASSGTRQGRGVVCRFIPLHAASHRSLFSSSFLQTGATLVATSLQYGTSDVIARFSRGSVHYTATRLLIACVKVPSYHATTIGSAEKKVAGCSDVFDTRAPVLLGFPARVLQAEDLTARQIT